MTALKFLILTLSLTLLVTLGSLAQEPSLSDFNIEKTDVGIEITVKMSANPGQASTIKIPTEGVLFNVDMTREINENDLFSSGLAKDINGDGDTEDILKLRKSNGRLFIEDLEVKAFSSSTGWQKTGSAEVYRLSAGAPGFLLYEAGQRLMAGMDHGDNKAAFEAFEGPFLQVILLEPCAKPEGEASLILEESRQTLFAFEPGMASPEPQWHRVQWSVIPANQKHKVQIKGNGEGVLVLSLNYSPSPGVRKRNIQVVQPLEL